MSRIDGKRKTPARIPGVSPPHGVAMGCGVPAPRATSQNDNARTHEVNALGNESRLFEQLLLQFRDERQTTDSRLQSLENEVHLLVNLLRNQPPAGQPTASASAGIERTAKRFARALRRRSYRFTLEPFLHMETIGHGTFLANGDDPQLLLIPHQKTYPYGWTRLTIKLASPLMSGVGFRLYIDLGVGFTEMHSQPLVAPVDPGRRAFQTIVYVPPGTQRLRLDPEGLSQPLQITEVRIVEITKQEALVAAGLQTLGLRGYTLMRLRRGGEKLFAAFQRGGIAEAVAELQRHVQNRSYQYHDWVQRFDVLTTGDRNAIAQRIKTMPNPPTFSVLMPVYNVEERYLRRAIDSVRGQLYPHWEFCIADDCSSRPHVARVLREVASEDTRIKVVIRPKNGHISAASNSALSMATGDFIALLDHDDELAPHALYMMAEEILAHPDACVVYSDEDKLDENGVRHDPYFKPDWNPDLLRSQNYISHLGVYRRELVQRIGGFRLGYEGSQDYDLVLRATEEINANQIRHVPHVLYHWRAIEGSAALGSSEKPYAYVSAEKALVSHLQRRGVDATVQQAAIPGLYRVCYALPSDPPRVSIIIPTRDQVDFLRRTIESILERTLYRNFEILVVDNQSQEPRTHAYLASLEHHADVRLLVYDKPFNFSAINNMAVQKAQGSVVALLNNDLEVINGQWLEELLSHALRPEVGAVGPKLHYPNQTLQHAGVFFGIGGVASHAHKHMPSASPGHFGRARIIQGFSAVTGACLVSRKAVYEEVGGLDEALSVAYNDLDYCLRLRQHGYSNIFTPYAELVHHESISRGSDMSGANRARFEQEAAEMQRRWGAIIANDPLYNPNLTFNTEDFSLAFPPRTRKPWQCEALTAQAAREDATRSCTATAQGVHDQSAMLA